MALLSVVRSNLSKYDQTSWCICLKWINFGSVLVLYKSQGYVKRNIRHSQQQLLKFILFDSAVYHMDDCF